METQPVGATARPSKVLKWLLILGLVIILNLFFNFVIKLVYEPPAYDKFCPVKQLNVQPQTASECLAVGGSWTDYRPQIAAPGEVVPKQTAGYCDQNFTCSKNFSEAQSVYNRNVFIALIILGILSLVAGFFLSVSSAVSLGLSLGGVLSLVIGSMRYWSDMHDYLRVIVLGIALVALIFLGVKKLRD